MKKLSDSSLKRVLSLLLAIVMMIGLVPTNAFAEVAPANWNDDNKIGRYWPIPHQGRIVKVSSAEILKNPSLRYIGGYTRPDGREVVRLAFGGYIGATSAAWKRLVLKPDHNLNELIDWNESGMGKKMPEQFPNNHDGWSFNEEFIKFDSLSAQQGGSGDLHVIKLGLDGTKTTNTGTVGVNFETPIDLVLNEGQTVKDLDKNPLIQMRLMDTDYVRIYSTTIDSNQNIPYSSYTMSTFIPVRVNLKQGMLNTDVVRNYENTLQSASSYIKYNEEKGYFDVYTRRTQGTVGSVADVGGSMNAGSSENKGDYGFMQTFDESLIDILKPQDESKTVAQIFIADENDKVEYPSEDTSVPLAANRIDYSKDNIKVANGVGRIEVTNNKPGSTFLWGDPTLTTYGMSTVVRYFVDKDKLKEKFGSSDLISYEFFSTLFATNKTGVEEFKSVPRDEDINLKRGDTIDIRFDGRRDLITLGTFDTRGSFIQIGDDQYKISLRTTADKASYVGGGIIGAANYMRKMTVSVPFDIKIKKDTPLTIFSRKTKMQEVSPGMTVTFNYSDKNISGGTITKSKTYRFERPLVAGYTRNEKGEIFKGSEKINKPQQTLFIDNHEPLMYSRQENFGGGILTKTVDVPDVDETFTDTTFLSGRSKYDRVNVYVYKDKDTLKKENRIATIQASDQKVKMNVNGEDVEGFQWASKEKPDETQGADNSAYVNPSHWALKDTGIYFTNQDVLQNALENDFPVVEQIQAKVKFDLNGGKLPKNVVSYQGIDSSKLLGTEFAYDLNRNSETEAITRIAPLNNKIRGQEGYTESGFTGDNVNYKDHNGGDLKDESLELRKMPQTDKITPSEEGLEFLGWTTQKIPGDATEEYTKLTEAKTVAEVKSNKNYIFTDKTPFDSHLTVYAAYGKPLVKLVLHRNMNEKDTTTEEIILKDTDFNSGKTINIPRMYYNTSSLESKDFIESFNKDNFQEDFLKKNTFVGWMLPNQANGGYREKRTYQAGALLENNGYTPQEMNDRAINLTDLSATKALPNTFGLKLNKTYAEAKKEGVIHLYASYRPFYTVNMKKQFKKSTDTGYKDLTSEEAAAKMHDVKFGLLYRTAVTNWNDPTVLQAANYYTLNPANLKDREILKLWKKDEKNTLTWSVPGYDILGQRISYIGVEVPVGEEKTYTQHKGADDWSTLGINVYMRIPESGGKAEQDPNAPFDPINPFVKLSKSQSVSIKKPDTKDVDAFTAATSRKPLGVDTAAQGKKDSKLGPKEIAQITGYEITVTNIPVDVETPKFKGNIYDGEKVATIYKPKDDAINKLVVTFTRDGNKVDQTFTKDPNKADTWTSATSNPAFKIVTDKDGDVVIQLENKDISYQTGDVITARFAKGDVYSKEATNTVQGKVDANKITDIEQIPFDRDRTEEPKTVKIKVTIPNPTPGAPGAGSKFTPGTIDKNGKFIPLEGVDPIVTGENLKPGEHAILEIPKTSIKHGDKIYFKSEEGRSKYDMIPGKNADKEGFGHVEIDLEGPVIKDALLKDDYFRMFANLKATLSEVPEDNAVKIIIKDKEGVKEQTFRTKAEVIDYFRAMGRKVNAKDMPEVKIIAYDKFNNKTEAVVKYEREEAIEAWLNNVSVGDEKLNVKSNRGATIKIEIRSRGKLVASANVDSATGDFQDINLEANGSAYKLKRGDIIIIEATNGVARANKLVRFVR